ncbi:endolytic transglycosylase MltG [Streptomyces sp. CT34]|uniref:endolytic transglycosylase MltG n=1 Tax=Streptomyces sp. CT34 TaxID=1553907 RepID=UPI0005BBAC44|nr:endolytic transglycosylase MltG [Streptomyces sp. CT34]
MTEYGRGYGSEPWHPEDPLYGDQGPYGGQAQQPQWNGQQPAGYPQQHPHPQQYPHPQQLPQQPQQQYDPGHGGWTGAPQNGQLPYDPYDPYGQHSQHPPADPYAAHGGQEYYGGQVGYAFQDTRQLPAQQAVPQQAVPPQDAQQYGQVPHPQHPDGHVQEYGPQHLQQGEPPYDDPAAAAAADDGRAEPAPAGREPGDSFFTDDPDDGRGDLDPEDEDTSGRERRGKKKKRRSGTACLVMTLTLAGVVGTVGYFGYGFFMRHFGSAPDYTGEGTGEVQVVIPNGVPLSAMGVILAKDGVIKSSGAFTEAADSNKKAQSLQPGTYSLRKQMSAAAAIDLMLDPKSRNGLTIREGLRAGAVYEMIDKKLKLKAGTTKEVAKTQVKSLGLPSWADGSPKIKDPLEGFLYPSTYSVGDNAKPADVLKEMVGRATREYQKYDLEANAQKFHLTSPLQLITVASLTQAEGMTHDDFRKMAAVVYNRLAPTNKDTNQKLEFDSTFNYLKNQSKINISTDEIRHYNDPYNTYFYKGLPPGPIGNPGADALKATINPDDSGKWLYFISVDGKTTEFTTNLNDHMKLVREFNKRQQEKKQQQNGS